MHGLGNDFIIFDARQRPVLLSRAALKHLAQRRLGIGCDQIIVLQPPRHEDADVGMQIFNADGSEVAACGNATRCVAKILFAEQQHATEIIIETAAGLLEAFKVQDDIFTIDMGRAQLDWQDIPLAHACDTNSLPLDIGGLKNPVAVNMGNPHAVFFVEDIAAVPLEKIGPQLEQHPIFPERANIEIAQIIAPDTLKMRVWERGVGITAACGTGACAVGVAAFRRQHTNRKTIVHLEGGALTIEYLPDGHVLMTGEATEVFRGEVAL